VYGMSVFGSDELVVKMFITCCIVEAAVQDLVVTPLNNSEVNVTWMAPEYFELKDFVVKYFFKSDQNKTVTVDRPPYQVNDLIPGQTYTVRVTSRYFSSVNNMVVEADATEDTVILDKIGVYVNTVLCMCIL